MEEEKYIVALEVGSSKIKGAVGVVDPAGTLTVKAVEEEKLVDSVRYGCVRNVAEVSRAIRAIIDRLELRESPRKIEGVYLAVGGRSLLSSVIDVERRLPTEMEITGEMIDDIFSEALSQPLHERAVIDVTPREFRVNGSPANRPVGNYGSSIVASLNLISCRAQLINNLRLVVEDRLHLKIRDIFVRQLIEGDLVLSNDEKRLGCMLVDFGAETTTVSIYKNGALQYLQTIPLGSRNITIDITSLNHLEERAEELKISGGNALTGADSAQNPTAAFSGSDFTEINHYVAARAGEIIANINEQMNLAGFKPETLPAGIIVVGQGARLNGFNRRLEKMTKTKVRVGMPGGRIRLADSHIQPGDAVDVISLLAAASRDAAECTSRPAVQQPVIMEQPEVVPEVAATVVEEPAARKSQPTQPVQPVQPVQQPVAPSFGYEPVKPRPEQQSEPKEEPKPKPKPKTPGLGTRILNSFRDRISDLFTEPDEDE